MLVAKNNLERCVKYFEQHHEQEEDREAAVAEKQDQPQWEALVHGQLIDLPEVKFTKNDQQHGIERGLHGAVLLQVRAERHVKGESKTKHEKD